MIQARELRKSNIVLSDGDNYEVLEIYTEKIRARKLYASGLKDEGCVCHLAYVDPIPLSPEVLVKCGFKHYQDKGVASFDEDAHTPEDTTHWWEMNVKANSVLTSSFNFNIVKWGNDSKDFTFSSHMLRVSIIYLHQLQNLFYSLTGRELEVNL